MAWTLATLLGSAKGSRPKLQDFLLRWDDERGRQTAQEQLDIFRALASQSKD